MLKRHRIFEILLFIFLFYLWFFTDEDSFVENAKDLLALIIVCSPLIITTIIFLWKANHKDNRSPKQISIKQYGIFSLVYSIYSPIGILAYGSYLKNHNPLVFDSVWFKYFLNQWTIDKTYFFTMTITCVVTFTALIPFVIFLNKYLKKKYTQNNRKQSEQTTTNNTKTL